MTRRFQAYYTREAGIAGYLAEQLRLQPGDRVLEPSGGDGALIDALLATGFRGRIDTYEIDEDAYRTLRRNYLDCGAEIQVYRADTLWDRRLDQLAAAGGGYEKIIANPPYGAWIDPEQRARLRQKYDGIPARESYTLFLYRCLKLLRPGGRLSFLIPDTYLFLRNHTQVRTFLFRNFRVERVLIFPSRLFPGVSFGYSNLSILIVQRPGPEEKVQDNVVDIRRGFRSSAEFAQPEPPAHVASFRIPQSTVLAHPRAQVLLRDPAGGPARGPAGAPVPGRPAVRMTTLGELAECVTGIYTGANRRFLAVSDARAQRAVGYRLIGPELIDREHRRLGPLPAGKKYLPLLKGSSPTRYIRELHPWLIRWDEEALEFYRRDRKARFQNSRFYFARGIAVPMVKSRQIRVTEFCGMVFDQSVVGVFPREEAHHDFLLAFLNTELAGELIHLVNPTANNSANYLKQIPVAFPDAAGLAFLGRCVAQLRRDPADVEARAQIEEFFRGLPAAAD